MKKETLVVASAVLIVVLGVAGLVSFFSLKQPLALPPIEHPADTEREAELQSAIQNASTKKEELLARFSLTEYYLTSKNAEEGYAELRTIAADKTLPAISRAFAIETMGETFLNRSDRSSFFLRKKVFVGEPYATWIDTKSTVILGPDSLEPLYAYALSIADLPISEYRLAEIATRKALRGTGTAIDGERAQTHLRRGDMALNSFLETVDPEAKMFYRGVANRVKGTAEGYLFELTGGMAHARAARDAFDAARESLKAEPGSASDARHAALIWTDMYYALFLFPAATAPDQALIKDLLEEISKVSRPNYGFALAMTLYGHSTSTTPGIVRLQKEARELAQMSTSFAALLKSYGWQLP